MRQLSDYSLVYLLIAQLALPGCIATDARARRLNGETLAFYDEFYMASTLDCEGTADWNAGQTHAWLKFKADLTCRAPWRIGPLKMAKKSVDHPDNVE